MSKSNKESEQQNQARRKILRTLVVGGGAVTAAQTTPDKWVRPMVQSVVLPVHAQTSQPGNQPGSPVGQFASGAVLASISQPTDPAIAAEPLSDELLEFFLPSAQAGGCPVNASCSVEFGLEAQDDGTGVVCVSGATDGFTNTTLAPSMNPVTMGPGTSDLGDFRLLGGSFQGNAWSINVMNKLTNVSSTITMSSGTGPCLQELG